MLFILGFASTKVDQLVQVNIYVVKKSRFVSITLDNRSDKREILEKPPAWVASVRGEWKINNNIKGNIWEFIVWLAGLWSLIADVNFENYYAHFN